MTPPKEPRLSRREALLLALGKADHVSLERERQSAFDGARGSPPEDPSERPMPSDDPNPFVLWGIVIGLALVALAAGGLMLQRSRGRWPFSRTSPEPAR